MVVGVAGDALLDSAVGAVACSVVVAAAGPACVGLVATPGRDVVPSMTFEASEGFLFTLLNCYSLTKPLRIALLAASGSEKEIMRWPQLWEGVRRSGALAHLALVIASGGRSLVSCISSMLPRLSGSKVSGTKKAMVLKSRFLYDTVCLNSALNFSAVSCFWSHSAASSLRVSTRMPPFLSFRTHRSWRSLLLVSSILVIASLKLLNIAESSIVHNSPLFMLMSKRICLLLIPSRARSRASAAGALF